MQAFSVAQRAMTVAGLAPAMLLGCAVHPMPAATAAQLPAPNYSVMVPVPASHPAPVPAPVPAPPTLVAQVDAITKNFDGVVGVAVRSVDEGWAVSSNGSLKLPQQSVSKLWVAMTVLDARDRGQLSLDDPLTITKEDFTLFHQPVAALVKGDKGYSSTVGEILKRALTMSDNTCNDKLLRYVGGPGAVRAFMARKGIHDVRFGPGEKLLQAGTAGLEWKPEYVNGGFERARARLPQSVRLAAFEAYVADPPDGAAPIGIADALAKLKQGKLLSPDSTAWLIGTMEKSHTGKQRLRGAVPPGWEFGHKTGTGQDLGARIAGYNDVGILTAPDGKTYTLAVMIGDTRRPIPARQELMHAVLTAVVANHRQES
jgi:beta-lactamase class A